MNRNSIRYTVAILLLASPQLKSQIVPELPIWHVDQDIKIDFELNSQAITMRIKNVGKLDRKISSTILDPKYLKLSSMRVSFINYNSPRSERDEFSLYGDGVIGSNSAIFRVKEINLAPGKCVSVRIDYKNDLRLVTNKKLESYLAVAGLTFRLSLKMDLSSVGVSSDSALVYIFPEMTNVPN